jgi:tetratricopeptide (TPR) repeat protein
MVNNPAPKAAIVCGPNKGWSFSGTAALVLWLFVAAAAWPQNSGVSGLSLYSHAVQSSPAQRMREMQQFLSSAPDSSLRIDALEVLVWDAMQLRDSVARRRWSYELLKLSPNNALARAAMVSDQQLDANRGPKQIEDFQESLSALNQLHKPEGMIPAEFSLIKQQTYVELSGAIGLAYLAWKDYAAAQTYLRPAVSVRPNDSRYVYALATALLQARHPDTANGFWYLARAVNLTVGTPEGVRIAQFARDSYTRNGGSNADWNQFVAVTSFGRPGNVNAAAYNGSVARATPSLRKAPPVIAAAVPPLPSRASSDLHDEVASRPQRSLPPATDPVSLGILVQTSLLKGENRKAIVFGLTDLARHLRDNDEAFIMAFSDQLDFQQDLTSQDKLLEEALDEIRPKSGAALVDGVAFAVAHLDRVGRNKNRVLLVISDGRNDAHLENGASPLNSQYADVRINCIAVNAGRGTDATFLQHLAQYSGGKMSYAADPQQVRLATSQIAQSMGIAFPQ